MAVASDGWTVDPGLGGVPHPRSYGTFVRVLGRYVREQRVLSLEAAVRKMTSMPAWRLGLADRGTIAPGMAADLVVFDPDRVLDRATYAQPHAFCDGVSHVAVNGHLAIDDGQDTSVAPAGSSATLLAGPAPLDNLKRHQRSPVRSGGRGGAPLVSMTWRAAWLT